MYKNDDIARSDRANALIDEIAELERKKLEHAATDHRLEQARSELVSLQVPAHVEKPPGFFVHVVVFGMTASAAFLGYTLLF